MRAWWLEAAAWVVGVVFRLGLFWGFDPRMGYDTNAHTGYMAYMAEHGAIPPIDLVWTANHPPLYYALCAGLHELGAWPRFEVERLQVLSIAFAVARLSLLWWGLRHVLPTSASRSAALLLAALLPSSIHGDGMITNETLNGVVGLLAIFAAYRAFAAWEDSTQKIWPSAIGLAVALTAALLTKISGLLIAAAVAIGWGLTLVRPVGPRRRSGPIALACLLAVAVATPVYGRHREATGLWLPTSFERNEEGRQQQASLPPYLERRPARYYLGTSLFALLSAPHYPNVVDQFPMVLLATTFVDYYNYSFVTPPPSVSQRVVNYRALAAHTETRMRWSILGGLVLAMVTLVAYVLVVLVALRRWRISWLVPLSIPVAGVLGQLHYATKYPFDYMGLVKSLYLQFGWAPLFACFGVAVAWALADRRRAPVLLLSIVGLVAIGQYAIHGVFEWPA